MDIDQFIGTGAVYLALAIFLIVTIFKAVRIVPQSEKYVVERFGRVGSVLGPGINFRVPYLDRVAHKVSVLERQLPNARQDAISADNVLLQVETSVFYRVTEPEKTVYRIRDVDAAIATTVAGIVRSEIGKLELDQVQSNRAQLIERVREQVLERVELEQAGDDHVVAVQDEAGVGLAQGDLRIGCEVGPQGRQSDALQVRIGRIGRAGGGEGGAHPLHPAQLRIGRGIADAEEQHRHAARRARGVAGS